MKVNTLLFTFFAFFLFSSQTYSQEKGLNKGGNNYKKYAFNPAIDIYERVAKKGFKSKELFTNLGNSYYYNADYKNAAKWYKELFVLKDTVAPEFYFRYAQCLKSLEEYKKSDELMQKFFELTATDSRSKLYNSQSDYLDVITANSGRYDVALFEYNSKYSDFAPSFYKDGLIFSSNRDTGNLFRVRHKWNNRAFLDLYQYSKDSLVEEVVQQIGAFRIKKSHESTSVTTKDGNTIYFTRNNFVKRSFGVDENGVTKLKIYTAKKVDGEWGEISELPFNSNSYSVAHPALSKDEKKLYFASDMPGTNGESDIFVVDIIGDGIFSEPKNLGGKLNTEARETFPFVSSEGILYFSSDGRPGLGGLDVYGAKLNSDDVGVVLNLGRPINGPNDDFTYIINEETKKGYFASNRPNGVGEDDIYSFVETKPLRFECIQDVTGVIRDKETNAPVAGAEIIVVNQNNDVVSTTLSTSSGEYVTELQCDQGNFIRVSHKEYNTTEQFVKASFENAKVFDFYLEPVEVVAAKGSDLASVLELGTIYFNFDSDKIRNDAKIELEKIVAAMEKYPSLKIEIGSHTDSTGNDDYNMYLSEKRAKSTVNYIVSQGIDRTRITGKGYGESQLLNTCANGVSCSDKEHQKNRRSEFIIVE